MTNQQTTTKEALEPCPLCGSTDLFLRDIAGWELDCRGCGLSLVLADDPTREGLVKRWNSRIPAPIVAPEVDEEVKCVCLAAGNQVAWEYVHHTTDCPVYKAGEIARQWLLDHPQLKGSRIFAGAAAWDRETVATLLVQYAARVTPASPVAPQQSERDKGTPLCAVHQRLEDVGRLECEIGNDCVACSLNERRELLALIAPFAAEGNTEDSVTVLRRVAEFYETHAGEGRVVVSYPAPASPAALGDEAETTSAETCIEHCEWCDQDYDFFTRTIHCPHDNRPKPLFATTPPSTLAKAADTLITENPFEQMIERALLRAGLSYKTDHDGTNPTHLDFYLPSIDVHIEVKTMHSDRIAEQMSRAPNVIVAQGKGAISWLAAIIERCLSGGGESVESE